jgi:FtsZ-interacting cell division protein ZipA
MITIIVIAIIMALVGSFAVGYLWGNRNERKYCVENISLRQDRIWLRDAVDESLNDMKSLNPNPIRVCGFRAEASKLVDIYGRLSRAKMLTD